MRLFVALFGVLALLCWAGASVVMAQADADASPPVETDSQNAMDDPALPAAEKQDASGLAGIEWIGMNLGWGFWYNSAPEDDSHYRLLGLRTDISLLTFLWPHAYWTLLEVHPTALVGALGGGMRAGYRLPLVADGSHEMRFGLAASVDGLVISNLELVPTMTLAPHAQYIANFDYGSVGVGLDLMLTFNLGKAVYQHESERSGMSTLIVGPALYFRWAWGSYFQ